MIPTMGFRISAGLLPLLAALHATLAAAQSAPKHVAPPALDFSAELPSAAYPAAPGPNVAVHVPAGFDAQAPLHLVVYLHGLRGCLPVLLGEGETRCDDKATAQPGWNLGAFHDAAGTQTVFVVPRLVYDKRGGQPGAFGKAGGFRSFLADLLTGPLSSKLGRSYAMPDVASLTLVAHSAGFETTLAILEHGDVGPLVRAVVLFDALYALEERYARYALAHADQGLRLIAIHLRGGRPAREGQKLYRRLVRALDATRVVTANTATLHAAVAAHPFVVAEGKPPHVRVPQHHMADVLSALSLPKRAAKR